MKVCQRPIKTLTRCRHCSKVFANCQSSARHQLRDHQDSWAVIDMMEAGMSEQVAGRLYNKSIRQGNKSFGSYYNRTKIRDSENIKREKIERTDWIVDDNISYDSDEQHDDVDKKK